MANLAHNVRTRSSPETTMVDFDLLLPPSDPPTLFPYSRYISDPSIPVDSLGSFPSLLQKPQEPLHGQQIASAEKPPPAPRPDEQSKTRAEIRRARAARNRSSARRSRLRKKAESMRDLQKAQNVQMQNESLKKRVHALRDKYLRLQKEVQDLGVVVEAELAAQFVEMPMISAEEEMVDHQQPFPQEAYGDENMIHEAMQQEVMGDSTLQSVGDT